MQGEKRKSQKILGRRPVLDAINGGVFIDKIFMLNTLSGEFEMELRAKTRQFKIPVVKVPNEKLDQLTFRQNHQGVVAFTSPVQLHNLEDVIPHLFESGKDFRIALLDGITDVGNFGAIARSALAFDIDYIVIPSKKTASITDDSIKASAGALLSIPVCREQNMLSAIDMLKGYGVRVFASSLHTKKTLDQVDFNGPIAVVLGAESRGVSREILALADEHFIIPQSDKMESLNVSVAAGIIFHSLFKK